MQLHGKPGESIIVRSAMANVVHGQRVAQVRDRRRRQSAAQAVSAPWSPKLLDGEHRFLSLPTIAMLDGDSDQGSAGARIVVVQNAEKK